MKVDKAREKEPEEGDKKGGGSAGSLHEKGKMERTFMFTHGIAGLC